MLTKRQLDCYNVIKEYRAIHKFSPSYDNIAEMLGIKSKNAVHRLIIGLESRGALERMPNRARAFRLLELQE